MRWFLLISLLSLNLKLSAQDSLIFVKKHRIMIEEEIQNMIFTPQHQFYFSSSHHLCQQNQSLDTIQQYHSDYNQSIHSFQHNNLTTFLFSQETQNITILNRFLTKHSEIHFSQESFIELACVDNEQNIWLIDGENLSLKKIDYRTQNILSETSLLLFDFADQEFKNITFHQNLVILQTESNFIIFDNWGTFKYQIPLKQCLSFALEGDYIYWLENEQIQCYHLFLHEHYTFLHTTSTPSLLAIQNQQVYILNKQNELWLYQKAQKKH
ncbi:MAG: hypothetical protein GY827_00260 [Cytophagales bacterium]|nr:hypothetical protein [Cytophagales bacterium]